MKLYEFYLNWHDESSVLLWRVLNAGREPLQFDEAAVAAEELVNAYS